MALSTKVFPTLELPYDTIESATLMMAKLFPTAPFLPILKLLEPDDSVQFRTLNSVPGVKLKERQYMIKTTTEVFKSESARLEKTYNEQLENLLDKYSINALFMEKYLQIIKKFESKNAFINILGPFSLLQTVNSVNGEQILLDKNYRKLFVQAVSVKALWIIKEIKKYCPKTTPVIIIDEPCLGQLGALKRENEEITTDIVKNMFEKIVNTIKTAGGLCAIQCFDKCDWNIAIDAGVDIISFDAYTNPNSLTIFPEKITEFISRGGKINWAIVPAVSESYVKSLNISALEKMLMATFDNLIIAGVPAQFVYKSALVSPQGNISKLPIIFAEKILLLTNQLAKKIPTK